MLILFFKNIILNYLQFYIEINCIFAAKNEMEIKNFVSIEDSITEKFGGMLV